MRASKLKIPFRIQEPVVVGTSIEWRAFDDLIHWAAMRPIRATERPTAQGTDAVITARLETRYIDGLKPKMRLLIGPTFARIAEIVEAFDPDCRQKQAETHIMVSETVDEG